MLYAGGLYHGQFHDLEIEAVRRKQGRRFPRQPRPSTVRGARDRGVQIEQELVGEAVDWRRLAEGEPQAHGAFDAHSVRRDGFFHQQAHEAAPAGVRPDIGVQ